MDKVTPLVQVDKQTNDEAITAVEVLLEKLRSGDVRAVALVSVNRAGSVSTCYINSKEGCYHHLNSGCARLASRIAGELDDTISPNPKDWVD